MLRPGFARPLQGSTVLGSYVSLATGQQASRAVPGLSHPPGRPRKQFFLVVASVIALLGDGISLSPEGRAAFAELSGDFRGFMGPLCSHYQSA